MMTTNDANQTVHPTDPRADEHRSQDALRSELDTASMRQDATPCDAIERGISPSLPVESVAPRQTVAQQLTPQQQAAISLLIVGRSALSVAATLGVHRSTIARWRHQHPLFAAELARQQRDVYDTASRRLRLLMVRAIDVVDGLLKSPRYQEAAAWRVLSGLRAAQWVTPPTPIEAETEEWIEEANTATAKI